MEDRTGWWRVQGSDIVDGQGEAIYMRGLCLGGWMSMENSVIGFPGNEEAQRRAVAQVLGEEKARFFFERFLDYFLTEADLRYIASLGANVVRVALNYRHFERDECPFEYKSEGFRRVDQIVAWAGNQGLHVILDLHAVQGWQNPGWHCDNPGKLAHFWGQKGFEERAVALWEALADRYRQEAAVAGYNLMNEPVASPTQLPWLHQYYRRATEAIRAVDPDHILFLDGNWYAQRCEDLEPPFDDNTVYGYHFYPEPMIETGQYPARIGGVTYDRAWLEGILTGRASFMQRYRVPTWAGEFGVVFTGQVTDEAGLRVVADMLGIMREAGQHWTMWHYKDIGPMGVVTLDPASEWMERTKTVRALKSELRCDSWIERHPTELGQRLDGLISMVRRAAGAGPGEWPNFSENMYTAVCHETISPMMLPAYAEQFRDMGEGEIDRMMQSFALENCTPRQGLAGIVRAACSRAAALP
jgi:endoglucanase